MSAVFTLATAAAACTFYTGKPDPPAPANGDTQSSGGKNGGGGSENGEGAEGSQAGAAGSSDAPPPWTDATGDLTGRSSALGGVVYLAARPTEDLLVAGVAGLGLWGSTDGGVEWVGLGQTGDSDLISHWVTSIVFDPEDPDVFWETGIYGGGGVFKTVDGGVTTRQLGVGMVTHNDLVSVDFSDPERRTLLAGWHELKNKVMRSQDGGETWEDIGEPIPESCGFSTDPLIIDSNTYLVGCWTHIVRSEDGGESWDIVSNAGGFGPPLLASDGAIYWRIDAGYGLMRSDDQGSNWVRVTGPGVVMGPLLELPDGRLASMNDKHVVVSDDQGESWAEVGAEFPAKVYGVVYSAHQRAFFTWTNSETNSVAAESLLRFDWDYETE